MVPSRAHEKTSDPLRYGPSIGTTRSPSTAFRRHVPSSGALETSADVTLRETRTAWIFSGGQVTHVSRLQCLSASKIVSPVRCGAGVGGGDGGGPLRWRGDLII